MKIGLIRHFPVAHPFLKGFVSQAEVLQWFEAYNTAPVHSRSIDVGKTWNVCYSSRLQRAKQTAELLFDGNIVCSDLLNEPAPSPLFRRNIRLPFLLWGLLFRTAILFNHASQFHKRAVIKDRVDRFLSEILTHQEENVLIISHAFIMEVLSEQLLHEGFTGKKLSQPQNGVLYLFERA